MKKAALYARVSSLIQKEEHTIESQLAELKRQIVKNEHVLVKEYIDDGYTGTRLDRPALEQMRQDLKTHTFDIIYFLCPDRIARDSWHQNIVIDDIIKHKKRMVINGEDYEDNPENHFKLTILGAVSQLERAKIVERTTRGRRHKLRMGQVVSQGHRTFGYRYVKKTDTTPARLEINAEEAEIVRKIYELYATSDYGLSKLCRWLEERNILTLTGKRMWRDCNIRTMLTNETYAGIRYYNRMYNVKESADKKRICKIGRMKLRDKKEWIGIKVPAIVSRELFEKVQAQLKERGGRYLQPKQSQLLSGLVRCGECGHSVSSYRRRVSVKLKIGIRRIYHKVAYICTWRVAGRAHSKAIAQRCKNPEVNTHILENKVFTMIKENMLEPSKLKTYMDFFKKDYRADQKRVEWKLMRLDKNQETLENRKQRLIDSHIAGQLTPQEYVDQNVTLDQELLKVKEKRDELLVTIPSLHKKDVVETSIYRFCNNAKMRLGKSTNVSSKRQFLLDHVEQIIHNKDKITIIGSVPIRLSDDNESDGSKIRFEIDSEFNKKDFHSKKRARYLVDSRLKEWGAGGRDTNVRETRMKELQTQKVKVSQVTQQLLDAPLRESIGYTASGRKKLQELSKEADEVYAQATCISR